MITLDCSDLYHALASLAAGAGISEAVLRGAIMGFEDEWTRWPREDPFDVMPREMLALAGRRVADLSLDGCLYFHASRTPEPTRFRREGLLCLPDALESIWQSLRRLADDVCSLTEWAQFRQWLEHDGGGHSGHLYRMKVAGSMHHGPFTVLVRESLLAPRALGHHDYLWIPEIVEDIAICFQERHGVDLCARFRAQTVPCIVTVAAGPPDVQGIGSALWYVYAKLRDGQLTSHANWGLPAGGRSLPASAVVGVETLPGCS